MKIKLVLVMLVTAFLISSCTVQRELNDLDQGIKEIEQAELAKTQEPFTIQVKKSLTQCSEPWNDNSDKSISDYLNDKGIYTYSIKILETRDKRLYCEACDCLSNQILQIEIDNFNLDKAKKEGFSSPLTPNDPNYCKENSDCLISGDYCSTVNVQNYQEDEIWCPENEDIYCSSKCENNECIFVLC